MNITIEDANELIAKAREIIDKNNEDPSSSIIEELVNKLEKGVLDHDFDGEVLSGGLKEVYEDLDAAVGPGLTVTYKLYSIINIPERGFFNTGKGIAIF